jgi:hypothetical protein
MILASAIQIPDQADGDLNLEWKVETHVVPAAFGPW